MHPAVLQEQSDETDAKAQRTGRKKPGGKRSQRVPSSEGRRHGTRNECEDVLKRLDPKYGELFGDARFGAQMLGIGGGWW